MQVNVEDISTVAKKIHIEIPTEQVSTEIERVYVNIQKKAKLQGFRPGKAPMQLIKRTYVDAMRDEVVKRLCDSTLFAALDEHKIEPVDTPSIDNLHFEEGTPFKYSALVEVLPQILLNEYTGLELQKEAYVENPEAVEAELEKMRANMAQLVPLADDAAIEDGHTVQIDYTFSVEGIDEESASDSAAVEVGSKRALPGFEEQLIGMKCGESKDIEVTLPEHHENPEFAGKKGTFTVTVKEIKRKELPELDNDFAKQFGDYETVDQLREKLTQNRMQYETERIQHELQERAITALIAKNPLDVPASMVKRQLSHMLESFKSRLAGQNMNMEMMGLDPAGFATRFHDEAVDKVKGGLLLMALIEKENVIVSESDITSRYEKMAQGNDDMLKRINDYYSANKEAKNALIAGLREEKAIDFLLEHAVITEFTPAEAPSA